MSGGLIGSRISLISRKDIRWEGILVEVDREKASVTLQNGEWVFQTQSFQDRLHVLFRRTFVRR